MTREEFVQSNINNSKALMEAFKLFGTSVSPVEALSKLYDFNNESERLKINQTKWLGEYSFNNLMDDDKIELLKYVPKTNYIQTKDVTFADRYLANHGVLYHGNDREITAPTFGEGALSNDYGQGFYLSPDIEMSKKWAWSEYYDGPIRYLHQYALDVKELKILNLTRLDVKCWLSLLCNYRVRNANSEKVNSISRQRALLLAEKFPVEDNRFDVIIGYRADDRFFTYIADFLMGAISLETLEKVMHLGLLGIQVFIKSKKAFNTLYYMRDVDAMVDISYKGKFGFIVDKANSSYYDIKSKQDPTKGTFILSLLEGDSW